MAVEIRELVIKATIVNDHDNADLSTSESQTDNEREQIIQECVNQVLKIIKKSKNR